MKFEVENQFDSTCKLGESIHTKRFKGVHNVQKRERGWSRGRVLKNVKECQELSENVKNAKKCQKMSNNVKKCKKNSENVKKCRKIKNILKS